MSSEKDEKISFIKHYQSSIEKSQDQPERVLHCLKKLKNIRVDVQHLKETGIGRTVNSCRKLEGEVADIATALVEKWKALVSENENDVNSRGNSKGSSPAPDEIKKSHDSSDDKKSKSHHHHHHHSSSSGSKDKSGSSKHHKHKSHRSSSSSHNGERDTKSSSSSSKKRSHTDAIEQESKENDAKKLKTEAVKDEKSNEQKSSNGHHKKEHKSRSSKKKDERKKSQEFDESQGIGFAEALASFDMPTTSSKHKKEQHMADKIVKVKSSESGKSFKLPSTSSKHEKSQPKPSTSAESRKSIQTLTQPPKLLTEKPKLDIMSDIVNELPNDVSIPEYRPLPLNSVMKDYINTNVYGSNSSQSRPNKYEKMTESEILAESFSSKANRTRVYSGNTKCRSLVPSLFNMCIRVLQENIDYLECTGGVPFDLLKPVLEWAKPEQLATIEYYNPYLLEESDVLWRPHCQRKWKHKQPQEMECWREMYERCTREDEEKLNRLTKHIRHNQAVTSSGIQKTKMAFVDSLVKPPRNMMRKQEQFGTSRQLVASPAARTEGLRHIAPNLTNSGDIRLRVQAGLRDDAQQVVGRGTISRGIPGKKAPMMAKILSKFKR